MRLKRKYRTIISILVILGGLGVGITNHFKKAQEPNIIATNVSSNKLASIKYDSNKYPDNYAVIDHNKVKLTTEDNKFIQQNQNNKHGTFRYSDLDKLGRTRTAEAIVTYSSAYNHSSQVIKRPAFSSETKVSGEYQDGQFYNNQWHGYENNNKIMQLKNYRGYIYNKSHLIAWSLGGSMETNNLVLGTRSQNVGTNKTTSPGGMAYTENKVRDRIYSNTNDKIFYKAVPIYVGNELIPRGVQVEVKSLTDDSFEYNVYVFNTQDGVNINYKTGVVKQI